MRRLVFLFLFYPTIIYCQDTTRVSILFTGDIMQHDSQINDARKTGNGQYDYSECFQYIKPYLESADITIGNLELTLAGEPYRGYPQFSAPDALAAELKAVGFDVLVTANNHALDRRKKGVERTISVLDSLEIFHTGTFIDTVNRLNDYPLFLEKNGMKIALLNFTYGTNGIPETKPNVVNYIDTTAIRKDLEFAIEQHADVRIVFVHWGLEYQRMPSAEQKRLAAFFFKHGAQIVIGSHPHVIQPMKMDTSANTFIAYSLGNFVSGQRDRYTDGGAMVLIDLEKIASDTISETHIKDASYELQWINRTADTRQQYFIWPVALAKENYDFTKANKVTQTAFETFISDSHNLLGKNNQNVEENMRAMRYEIKSSLSYCDSMMYNGMETKRNEASCYWGNFASALSAEEYLRLNNISDGEIILLSE